MGRISRKIALLGLSIFMATSSILLMPVSTSALNYEGLPELVPQTYNGDTPSVQSVDGKISADGRFVFFWSRASNLVPNDTNDNYDIFARDRQLGITQRISTTSTGGQISRTSGGYDVSDDGRYLVFASDSAELHPQHLNQWAAYLKDLQTGSVTPLFINTFTGQGVGVPVISGDGNIIAFSVARLLEGDSGANVYVINRNSPSNLQRITNGTGGSSVADINYDGSKIVFSSSATDLVANDTNNQRDIFVWDRSTSLIKRVSVSSTGAQANNYSNVMAHIDDSGNRIVFDSYATNLTSNSTNTFRQRVFMHDLTASTTTLLSANSSGVEADQGSSAPNISGDGRYVVFLSSANNLSDADTDINSNDVYVADIATNTVTLASGNPIFGSSGASGRPSLSYDGTHLSLSIGTLSYPSQDVYILDSTPLDTMSPNVMGSPDRAPNSEGWYNSDVNIDWNSVDPVPSSGTPTDPANTVASIEGAHTYISDPSCDPAGNCATGNLTLSIDKTAPTLLTPNWSTNPILSSESANFTVDGSDTHSGLLSGEFYVDTDPGVGNATPLTLNGNTFTGSVASGLSLGEHSIGIRAQDKAGNWSTLANTTLTVEDRTPPQINYTLSGATANTAGWYREPVTLDWSYDDPESLITSVFGCDMLTISTDTSGVSPSCSVTSSGGTSTEQVTIKYDATAPTLGTPTWSANSLPLGQTTTLSIPATDTTSGVSTGEYFLGSDPGTGNATALALNGGSLESPAFGNNLTPGVYPIGIRAQDIAGNWSPTLTTYLVVYNPSGPGYIVGHQNITPTSSDILPWLSTNVSDFATFGFNVKYGSNGSVDSTSKFNFRYVEKGSCNSPNAPAPCRSFILNANTFDWLSIGGTNYSQGIFQGTAVIDINGTTSTVLFRVDALDGGKLSGNPSDGFILKIFPLGSNAQTDSPLYQVTADFTPVSGNATGGVQIKQ